MAAADTNRQIATIVRNAKQFDGVGRRTESTASELQFRITISVAE
jgi:hypothetical protein